MRRAYPAEVSAYFAAMAVQPDQTRRDLIEALIAGLKADGIWAKLDALYLMAAHHEQAGRLNMVAPTEVMTPVASPTFTVDRGYNGDGAASYLNDGVSLSARAKFQLNDASMFVWVNSGATSNSGLVGSFGSAPDAGIVPARASSSVMRTRFNDGTSMDSGATVTTPLGLSTISRQAAGTYSQYKGNALLATITMASVSVPNNAFNVGRSVGLYNPNRVAAAGLGGGLSAGEVAALHARLNTFLTAIGAN